MPALAGCAVHSRTISALALVLADRLGLDAPERPIADGLVSPERPIADGLALWRGGFPHQFHKHLGLERRVSRTEKPSSRMATEDKSTLDDVDLNRLSTANPPMWSIVQRHRDGIGARGTGLGTRDRG
jgi:hypothetical protein